MKNYDYKAAKRYIQMHSDLIKEVSLGIEEDWYWTSEVVYEDLKFIVDLDKVGLEIGGISGSIWATPTMKIIFKDGTELFKDVFTGESNKQRPDWFSLGCMSQPVQDEIDRKTVSLLPNNMEIK